MKILRLQLDAFGPFTGVALDLSAGNLGLHLIHGPNEAGKTSALRAIRNLFYGIPLQSPDRFLHEYNKMRLGATLELADGERLAFTRWKRNKDPLCDEAGTSPIEPSELTRFLGGVDEPLFSAMFGIDHDSLIEGGKEIIRGGGRLGETLFSASSGIAGLRTIHETLKNDLQDLFIPRGVKQSIPVAIRQIRDAQTEIRQCQVTTEEWSRQDQALKDAQAESARLDEQIRRKQGEAGRLRRVKDALPLVSERAELLDSLAKSSDAVILPDDFPERRRKAESNEAVARREAARATETLEELRGRLASLPSHESILEAEAEIERLYEERGKYRAAQLDRPRVQSFVNEDTHAARVILRELGKPNDLDQIDGLALRVDEPIRIQTLAIEAQKLATQREETREALAKHQRAITKFTVDLDQIGQPGDLAGLKALVKEITRLGAIEERRDDAARQLGPLEKSIQAALRKLPGWSGDAGGLEALAVPLPETIAKFEARWQDSQELTKQLDAARKRETQAIEQQEARLQAGDLARDLPTLANLQLSRERRDRGWSIIRRSWLEHAKDPASEDVFIQEVAPGKSLADAYEAGVSRTDRLADRLHREATDVARRDEILAAIQSHRVKLDAIDAEEARSKDVSQSIERDWRRQIEPIGLAGLSPAELRSWLERRQAVLGPIEGLRSKREEVEALSDQIAREKARLHMALQLPDGGESLAILLDRAGELLKANDDRAKRRDRLETGLEAERAGASQAESKLTAIDEKLATHRESWGSIMERIGLDRTASQEQATVFVEHLRKLQELSQRIRSQSSRLKGIDRDAELFAGQVRDLSERIAPGLAEQAPEVATENLFQRLREAREDRQASESLSKQIAQETKRLQDAEAAIDDARVAFDSLLRESRCGSIEELPECERRSRERSKLDAGLRRVEDEIRRFSAGLSVPDFVAEAGRHDPDTLEHLIAKLDEEISALNAQIKDVNQQIGSSRTTLATMDGSGKAAEANGRAAMAMAKLQSDVERYAALRLAEEVLRKGIERYRERNQAPVLNRASELFSRLSARSFSGLRIEYNDKGEAFIAAVRSGTEATLTVDCMSEGSCDQLYLALRVASLEHWLDAHEPIPLILDDVLLQFDDQRSAAALEVFAELSKRTQVLFFTHHAHLRDLAEARLPADVLYCHELRRN